MRLRSYNYINIRKTVKDVWDSVYYRHGIEYLYFFDSFYGAFFLFRAGVLI